MKSFSQYLHEMESLEFSPGGEPQYHNDSSGLLGALQVAVQKHRAKVEKFLNDLASEDKDIRKAMGNAEPNDGYPPEKDDDDDSDPDNIVPPHADTGSGSY